VISLCALLLNDLYLKWNHPGVISGKLSDFAGIFLVSLLLFALTSPQKLGIAIAVCAAFVWWKSPMSGPFIRFVQEGGVPWFGRVVDHTDLLALGMLLPASWFVDSIDHYQISRGGLRRVIAVPAIGITAVAILGTSSIPLVDTYSFQPQTTESHMQPGLAADVIRAVAEKNGLKCLECDRPAEGGLYQGHGITMRYVVRAPRIIAFSISGEPTGLPIIFLSTDPNKKMDKLRDDLRAEFGRRFGYVQFVETLPNRRKGE
jgi:hypothetical protein